MSYSPEALAVTLSRRCNLQCEHCVVEAGPREKQVIDERLADRVFQEASRYGIRTAVIYGGEPFLFKKDLLPQTIETAFIYGMDVSVATNGFWGRSEASAKNTLQDMEDVAARQRRKLHIGLSVDQYHQPAIPPKSIANIIEQFRLGNFGHLELSISSFREQASWEAVGEVYKECHKKNILLMEANDQRYLYPALQEEFVEVAAENYPTIAEHLGLPADATLGEIQNTIVMQKRTEEAFDVVTTIIAVIADMGQGQRKYLIFPKKEYVMGSTSDERVLNAGRARKEGPLEISLEYGRTNFLVISPDGKAYAYPAQMVDGKGIEVGDKPLELVIAEVATANGQHIGR